MVVNYGEGKKKINQKPFPLTYIVIEFNKKIKLETAQWIVNKLIGKKHQSGAELLVKKQPFSSGKNLTLHVTAHDDKLLELAEELEVRKRDKNGILREFTLDEINEFINVDHKDLLLTLAEKQVIVRHEIENVRALNHEISILGYTEYPLYEGQSIISACLHHGLINQVYPLHDREDVKKLGFSWYNRSLSEIAEQPFEEIRTYFGESIALYFQFLGFYTNALIVPMVLGFLQMILYPGALAFFCIINIICATLFLELWRRKCSELAYIWGTITMTSFDEPRPNFRGVMGVDSVTGKLLPQAPRFKTHIKMYCVSFPLVFVCMFGAFSVMIASFWVEDWLKTRPSPGWMLYLPSSAYAAVIPLMNHVYRRFANFLTEWENHRTQSQFDRHRVTKLVLFEFVNNFMSLFYIAFVVQDIELLRYQLALLLIVYQLINNFQEAVLPLLLRHFFKKTSKSKNRNKYEELISSIVGIEEIESDDPILRQAVEEGLMDVYDDPYDDYLELFVQFGYVFLFSAVYPMAAFWAFVNNLLEIRSDGFKWCMVYQRPMARKVKDTGAWQRSFQALCALSVMTNCVLLSLSPSLRELAPNTSQTKWFLIFVVLEHLLLGLRQVIHYAIPDKPEWVKVALAKGNYQSKQALKMQRLLKNKAKRSIEQSD